MHFVEAFILHPFTGLAGAIVLTVIGWKLNTAASDWLLILAWMLIIVSLFRTAPISFQPLVPRILLTMLVASLFGLALTWVSGWQPVAAKAATNDTGPPVLIEPHGEFSLYSGNWSNTTRLVVQNTSPTRLYSVILKIWTESAGVKSEDILIRPTEDNPHAPLIDIGHSGVKLEVNGDVLMWDFTDSENRETVHVRFYELGPNEIRHLSISGQASVTSSAFTKVLSFKTEPDNVMTQRGTVAFIITSPESGQLKSIRWKTGQVSGLTPS